MSGVGGGKKRKIEEQERIDWILARVQIGMSKSEIMRQTEARYGLSTTQSRVWYIKAADSLISIDKDHKDHRARVKSTMLEVIHAQIMGLQQDLNRISGEIQSCELARESRSLIQTRLIDADDPERERLKRELSAIKTFKPRYYLDCISQRSKFRISIVKCVVEIGRLEGLYVEELGIIRAIAVLSNSELIPSNTASSLIDLLNNLEFSIDSLQPVAVQNDSLN